MRNTVYSFHVGALFSLFFNFEDQLCIKFSVEVQTRERSQLVFEQLTISLSLSLLRLGLRKLLFHYSIGFSLK